MKCVCISCFNYYDIRMKTVIEHFKNKGYDVTYIISDFDHYTKKRYVADYENTVQIKVVSYNKNLSANRLMSHYIFAKKVYKELCNIQPDLVYSMFPPNSLVKQVARYKEKTKCKVIYDCYDLWPESFPYEKYERLLKIPFSQWKKLRDKYLDRADLLLCVSEVSREALIKLSKGTPIHILEPAIKLAATSSYYCNKSEGLSFCYLGNVNHITDVDLGVKLLALLAKYVDVQVHFIGEGQNFDDFIIKLEDSGVKVIKHGIVFDMEEKNCIFAKCNLGLNIPRKEIKSSMSLKSVEYLRAGLPFINSGIGDTQLLVDKEAVGINIDCSNIEETVKEIMALSEADLQRMHDNCVNFYNNRFLSQDIEKILSFSNI